jgi:hypothetical protein
MDKIQLHQKWLLILLVINIVVTAFHYTDNYLDFERYPDPNWVTQQSIWIAWLILTIIGISGYVLYLKRVFWLAYLSIAIYSITGAFSPGHYFFPEKEPFSFKMHTLIWLDAIAGAAILVFIIYLIADSIYSGDKQFSKPSNSDFQ